MSAIELSVIIATRNRPTSLERNLRALEKVSHLVVEVIIGDDSSDPPVDATAVAGGSLPVRVIRIEGDQGPIVSRNRMAREARGAFLLSLDDDAFVLNADAIEQALDIMRADGRVAAVAFSQANPDGSPWPMPMQPSRAVVASEVTDYIGFAALLRRETFLKLGGYREQLRFYSEEKEFSLRLAEADQLVVHLPGALVAHQPDPSGRSIQRYLRQVVRNDCLHALYNFPAALALVALPYFVVRYLRMCRLHDLRDRGGIRWLVRELFASLPDVRRHRKPVRRTTLMRWSRLKRDPVPYSPQLAGTTAEVGP